jgi:hypothetical protein
MSTDYAKTILEILKLAPRYLVSLGIVSAFFLFSPDKWLKEFGVYDFAQHYRAYFFCVFILTSVLFGVDRAIAIFGWICRKMLVSKFTQRRLQRLHRLTEDEKQILRFYFAKQTRSNVLRIDDGVVNGLAADGVIFRSANVSGGRMAFAHNISDEAWDYICHNQTLLDGTTNTYRSDAWTF